MIIVTGGAGFIGSNLVKRLNEVGRDDVILVDELSQGIKFRNIADLSILDYLDAEEFLQKILRRESFAKPIEAIFHQGACSNTMEWDGRYLLKNNYHYSREIFHYCAEQKIPMIYASSAAVYGGNKTFKEERAYEAPLNVYGYSKMLFDHYVIKHIHRLESQVVGLRYFNVYGPRESHKANMASVAFHFNNQIKHEGVVKLFKGSDGYEPGEQRRDFVFVDDVVNVNLWFLRKRNISGLFNVGTGRCQSFNDVAHAVIAWHGSGRVAYIPFPDSLHGCYQSYTQADITKLRQVGYDAVFKTVEEGVKLYLDWLND